MISNLGISTTDNIYLINLLLKHFLNYTGGERYEHSEGDLLLLVRTWKNARTFGKMSGKLEKILSRL